MRNMYGDLWGDDITNFKYSFEYSLGLVKKWFPHFYFLLDTNRTFLIWLQLFQICMFIIKRISITIDEYFAHCVILIDVICNLQFAFRGKLIARNVKLNEEYLNFTGKSYIIIKE